MWRSKPPSEGRIGGTEAMVVLAPGVRMDAETLDEAMHVAAIAAKQGGLALRGGIETIPEMPTKRKTGWGTTRSPPRGLRPSPKQRTDEAHQAAHQVLEESGMGFDVYRPRGEAPKSAWESADAGAADDEPGAMDAPLPRPPTWLVHFDDCPGDSGPCVSVALVVNHIPAAGAIFDAGADKTYAARHGGEVFVDAKPLSAPEPKPSVDTHPIVTHVSVPDAHEADAYREHFSGTMSNLLRAHHTNLRVESCAARCLLLMATGRAAAFWSCGPKAAEVAAGVVLARAAGAVVTNPGDIDDDKDVVDPTARLIAEAEAREIGDNGEAQCDIACRRILAGVTTSDSRVLETHMAGPIPYAVQEEEHPLADDLQLRRVVLGMDPEEPNTSLEELFNAPRWSDSTGAGRWSDEPRDPAERMLAAVPSFAAEPTAPPRKSSVFATLRRKPKEPVLATLDDTVDFLPPPPRPLSRREAEIRRLSMGFAVDEGIGPVPHDDGVDGEAAGAARARDRESPLFATPPTSSLAVDDYHVTAQALEEAARELHIADTGGDTRWSGVGGGSGGGGGWLDKELDSDGYLKVDGEGDGYLKVVGGGDDYIKVVGEDDGCLELDGEGVLT